MAGDDEVQRAVEIGVIKEQINGIREQQKTHMVDTKEMFGELFEQVSEINLSLSRGRGMFAGAMMAAGVAGGIMAKAIGVIFR